MPAYFFTHSNNLKQYDVDVYSMTTKYCKLAPGTTLVNTYLIEEELGRGRFSMVYGAIKHNKMHVGNSHTDKYAIKIYRRGQSNKEYFDNELEICKQVHENRGDANSQFVIKYVGAFAHLVDATIYPCIVFKRYGESLRDLFDHVNGGMPMESVKSISKQIYQGLSFLHNIDIIHTDIKPENILLTKCIEEISDNSEISIVIADIGSSSSVDAISTNCIGTEQYLSPEVIVGTEFGTSTDIWSTACLVYELATSEYLFTSEGPVEAYESDNDSVDSDGDYSSLINLLGSIESLIGPAPARMARKYTKLFVNGKLRGNLQITPRKISQMLMENFDDIESSDATKLERFVLKSLNYLPRQRPTAQDLLEDEFFK